MFVALIEGGDHVQPILSINRYNCVPKFSSHKVISKTCQKETMLTLRAHIHDRENVD